MKHACEFLETLCKTSSRNAKLKLLKENKSEAIKFLLETALHPMLTFGVANLKESEKEYTGIDIPTLKELRGIRTNLVNRVGTGKDARDCLRLHILTDDPITRKWLTRAFNKLLRAGISATTVNKAYPNLIPEFPVGLCQTFEDKGQKLPGANCTWCIEPKLDGLRCLALIDENGKITFVSRNNKPLYNTGILEKQLKTKNLVNVILDGELFGKDWNASMGTARSFKKDDGIEDLTFYIFDAITMKEWKTQTTRSYISRKAALENSIGTNLKNVKLVTGYIVNTYEQAKAKYNDFMKQGYEGAVLKSMGAPYPFKRGKSWLKWKTMITVDLEIVNYEPGEGRNAKRLGAFFCDYKGKTVKVGSGYSDELREKFWKEKEEMLGQIIEVQAQEVTKDGSLRFPVFLKVRFDKDKGE